MHLCSHNYVFINLPIYSFIFLFIGDVKQKTTEVGSLLPDWESVCSKIAWGPIIIMGGGIALAEACQVKPYISLYVICQMPQSFRHLSITSLSNVC